MNAFEKHSNMDIYKMLSLMTLRKKNHFINDRMMKLSEVKCFGQRFPASEWQGLGPQHSAYSLGLQHCNLPHCTSQKEYQSLT